jgi:hypothetical protein
VSLCFERKARMSPPLKSLACALALCAAQAATQDRPITPKELQAALAAKPSGSVAVELASRIRATVGAENLKNGTGQPRTEETWALFALETKEGEPRVTHAGNIRSWPLTRIGDTDVYAGAGALPNFALTTFQYEVNGKRIGGATVQMEYFPPHPESQPRPEVPKGAVTKSTWKSTVFPGTVRDYWVYVPAQ